jgi:hypothetical protein
MKKVRREPNEAAPRVMLRRLYLCLPMRNSWVY